MREFIFGVIVGMIVIFLIELIFRKKPIGNLSVVRGDENYIFLELEKDISNLVNDDRVVLKVKTKDIDSRN